MAISISSSMVKGASTPSPFSLKTKDLGMGVSSGFFDSINPISLNCYASHKTRRAASKSRLPSKKLFRVQSTILQENEEKVVVEESFDPKSFPEKKGEGTSSGFGRWISINISSRSLTPCTMIVIMQGFFVLETIARVPYFAFISVLHMYESFGWWRRADYLKVHFAETWNEMHHLLIMEELGGNAWWVDRFLAQNIAIFYYFMTVLMYTLSPRMAYHFSECVESHAYKTYNKFIKTRGEELKRLPASKVAVRYYTEGDLYLFDLYTIIYFVTLSYEFQTARPPNSRRPKIENLYDVFVNIRDDEAEHCKTMKACQTHGSLRSPHSFPDEAWEEDSGCILPQSDCEGIADCINKSIRDPPGNKK
ncbi:hypothetical protein ACJIZ3_012792 [Penstemon smallii]|uniref:Ubiquinol oxidase n=1 Tax=Penstemon smallii TaxID=265156 RepID=A0ABD3UNE0_9LAMI